MVYLSRSYYFKFFKGCLPQILLVVFLNILSQMMKYSEYTLGCLIQRGGLNNWGGRKSLKLLISGVGGGVLLNAGGGGVRKYN